MTKVSTSPLLLFDGVCNLCSGTVQFILKHDQKEKFTFASLQSDIGQKILEENDLSTTDFQSFILMENGTCYARSTAALKVSGYLGFPYNLLLVFLLIPRPIRDYFYNIVAKNRYRWFGKKESCWLPTPELKKRFIE